MSSLNEVEDDNLSPLTLDDDEIPRKKVCPDKPSRKGWSLTDRREDQEVLQEMGLGILEMDEHEFQCEASTSSTSPHKSLKRKHNIENVNPNVNSCVLSSWNKHCPGSPAKIKCGPSPGPSKGKSPRSSEKVRPLQPTEQLLETSLLDQYLIDEETPLAQSVNADYVIDQSHLSCSSGTRTRLNSYSSPQKQDQLITNRECCFMEGVDSFSTLSDEMMLSVFKWLPKRTLAHCMLVCKRWYQVASDESLWQRLDLGNKTIAKDALGRIISRKPWIIRLANSEIAEWHPTGTVYPCRIQYLDLGICNIDQVTLDSLLERCNRLKKLSLESVQLYDTTCNIIGNCKDLETLNLTMAQGLSTNGIKSILENCVGIQSLNISWCSFTEEALEVVVATLPRRIQRLNIGGAKCMTNQYVSQLVARCSRLLELDISDCSQLGAPSVESIMSLPRLEHLALSRCYCIPPHALTKLSGMPVLQYLEVWGMLQTSSLNLLKSALPAIQVNQFMFSAIARPTVGSRRTSIWGLRTRD